MIDDDDEMMTDRKELPYIKGREPHLPPIREGKAAIVAIIATTAIALAVLGYSALIVYAESGAEVTSSFPEQKKPVTMIVEDLRNGNIREYVFGRYYSFQQPTVVDTSPQKYSKIMRVFGTNAFAFDWNDVSVTGYYIFWRVTIVVEPSDFGVDRRVEFITDEHLSPDAEMKITLHCTNGYWWILNYTNYQMVCSNEIPKAKP